jgi:hypothetical protein
MRVVVGSMGSQWINEYAFRRSFSDMHRDCAGIPNGKNFWALAEDMIEERRRRIGLQVRRTFDVFSSFATSKTRL